METLVPSAAYQLNGNDEIHWLSEDEADDMFDRFVRQMLGISGEEFLRRWDAGEYGDLDDPERPELMRVGGALPFARTKSRRS